MKVVGGPRRISNPKPLLYLCGCGSLYLCSEKKATSNGRAKYFREGSKRMYCVMPTWFRSEELARAAAKAMGFRVTKRTLGTANAQTEIPHKRRAGGKT